MYFGLFVNGTVVVQWGAYQIDVFSNRCDEHRQKKSLFEIVFQRYVICI